MLESHNLRKPMKQKKKTYEDFTKALNVYFIKLKVGASWTDAMNAERLGSSKEILIGNYFLSYHCFIHRQWAWQLHCGYKAYVAFRKKKVTVQYFSLKWL